MQQRRAAIHLALLLSLSSHTFYAAYAQVGPGGLSPSPSPDPGLPGGVTSSPSPNPSVSPSPGGVTSSPSPGPSVSPSVTSSPTPDVIPPGTSPGSSSGAPSPSPSPAATTIPTTPLPGTSSPSPGTGVTPSPDSPTPIPGPSPSPEPPQDIGWLMPVPDETAIDNVTTRDECALTSALFGVMGANYSTKCNGSSSSSGGSSGTPTFSEYRSGVANRGGLVTTAAGAQFCVSHDAAHQVAAESTRLQFASVDGFKRQLPNVYDPACDDPDAIYRPECSGPPVSESFYEDVTSNNLITSPSPDDGSGSDQGNQLGVSPSPDPDALVNCSTKFTRAGSNPRSVAIILLRWDRKYYKTKEECCEEQDNKPGCDCNWGGFSYDNLPPPKAYSRLFTDECDQGPSINRAYYDLSGGKVTFHGKLRVPVPQGALVDPEADNTTEANTIPSAMAAPVPSTSSDGSTAPEPPPAPAPVPPPPATPPAPYVVPTEPIETATSYQDPNGVDVYGWATLPGMRTPQGYCSDWCGDAMKQLGVNENDYNHVMCLQLLASKALCDTCKGDCIGTCPVTSGITTGCGCATCYYAWGGQTGCNRPAPPGIRVGMAANSKVYEGDMLGNAGGPFIAVAESLKQFVSHEIGHNMGLTHTGSVSCKVNGDVVMREPQFCTPDWYGDFLGFMGSSSSLSLPNALRYKVRWLPRATLRTHPQGEEQTYALRAATSRRPSWQNTTSESVRWFTRDDTLTVRVQMRNPPGSNQNISSYSCPCGSNYGGSCPESCGSSTCEDGPCCLDIACADKGLNWLYIELHQPYRNDYESSNAGIAIRMFGELSECTSTRLVPAYAKDGQPVFLLTKADPTGQTPGSKFEDTFRGVRVVLESWNKSRATIRVWSA